MRDKTYILSISKTKDRTQTITDAEGARYATVSLGTKSDRYDITLEDGTVLECTVNGKTWVYTTGGKEVIRGWLLRENGKKKIVISSIGSLGASPVVVLSCLERAADRYVSSASTTPVIILAMTAAILQVATADNNQPEF